MFQCIVNWSSQTSKYIVRAYSVKCLNSMETDWARYFKYIVSPYGL